MKSNTVKMSKQGQITIPANIRKHMPTSLMQIFMDKDQSIRIIPINSVAATLKEYAKGGSEDFAKVREKAWQESARNK